MFYKLFWIAVAGGFGTVARYSLAGAVHKIAGSSFPWGTFTVNAVGCFVAGLFWAISEYHLSISSELRTIILIGFFGAFTTFSSLMIETAELTRSAEILSALKNIVFQNVIGALCVAVSILLVRSLKGG